MIAPSTAKEYPYCDVDTAALDALHEAFEQIGRRRKLRTVAIFLRDGGRCQLCGMDLLDSADTLLLASVDHVLPRAAGGSSDLSNLVTACTTCNSLKAAAPTETLEEARQLVARRRTLLATVINERLPWFREKLGREAGPVMPGQVRLPVLAEALAVQAEKIASTLRCVQKLATFAEPVVAEEGGAA